MFTFKRLGDVPDSFRSELDQLAQDAEEDFDALHPPVDRLEYPGFDRVGFEAKKRAERDRATVPLVVMVVNAVVDKVFRAAEALALSPVTLQETATMLRDQFTQYIYVQKHSKFEWRGPIPGREVTLDDFRVVVQRELQRSSLSWSFIESQVHAYARAQMSAVTPAPTQDATDVVPTPAAPVVEEPPVNVEEAVPDQGAATARKADNQAIRKAERERVVLPLLIELGWSVTRWATEASLNPSVTLDYMAGISTLRTTSRTRLTNVLVNALGRPVRLPQ